MHELNLSPVPRSFYWISGIAILWNLIGILTYLGQVTMSPETLAELPPEQRSLYQDIPLWATSAYAIAVNAGVVGSILLLLRKAWALPVLILSLAGILVQFGHSVFMTDILAVMGPATMILPVLIIGIGIFLIWYFLYARRKGWIP